MKKVKTDLLVGMLLIMLGLSACGQESVIESNTVQTEISQEAVSEELEETDVTEVIATVEPESNPELEQESTTEPEINNTESTSQTNNIETISISEISEYSGNPYVVINDNQPYFETDDYTTSSFEDYSELDSLGRCGVAYACVGVDVMPTEERGSIGQVKPTGWHTVKYDIVDGKYLYNRCHLIGYQLTAENANTKNLITGTRYLNVDGMLPFENLVADYVKETENHVLYRVTPIFEDNNLVASGVLMEAWSVEDNGDGVCFNVYVYNVQPGVQIDYATGESALTDGIVDTTQESVQTSEAVESTVQEPTQEVGTDYILNTNTMKFHYPSCSSVDSMNESNKQSYTGNREDLISQGYSPCGRCNP